MIYDCFTFFNELDLLEMRMEILSGVVDRFVVVEMDSTHTGSPKPFIFDDNRKRFAKFEDKIVYVKAKASAAAQESGTNGRDKLGNDWTLEDWQRAQIGEGIRNCSPGDMIMVADVDEIPSPQSVLAAAKFAAEGKITAFSLPNYNFFLDFASTEAPYAYAKAMSYESWCGRLPCEPFPEEQKFHYPPEYWNTANANKARAVKGDIVLKRAGWHFSYLGGVEKILQKRRSITEQQFNKGAWDDADALAKRIYGGRDMYGRGYLLRPLLTGRSLPEYLRKNRKRYGQFFYSAPFAHKLRLNMRVLAYLAGSKAAAALRPVVSRKTVAALKKRVTG